MPARWPTRDHALEPRATCRRGSHAGAAERHAAAELRAGHAEHVTPTQSSGRVAIDIDAVIHAIDFDPERYGCLVDVNSLKRRQRLRKKRFLLQDLR
jgi:hypothetical protein